MRQEEERVVRESFKEQLDVSPSSMVVVSASSFSVCSVCSAGR